MTTQYSKNMKQNILLLPIELVKPENQYANYGIFRILYPLTPITHNKVILSDRWNSYIENVDNSIKLTHDTNPGILMITPEDFDGSNVTIIKGFGGELIIKGKHEEEIMAMCISGVLNYIRSYYPKHYEWISDFWDFGGFEDKLYGQILI